MSEKKKITDLEEVMGIVLVVQVMIVFSQPGFLRIQNLRQRSVSGNKILGRRNKEGKEGESEKDLLLN